MGKRMHQNQRQNHQHQQPQYSLKQVQTVHHRNHLQQQCHQSSPPRRAVSLVLVFLFVCSSLSALLALSARFNTACNSAINTAINTTMARWWTGRRMRLGTLLAPITRRLVLTSTLLILLLSGVLSQFASAQLGMVPTVWAHGPNVSHVPNTLARFRSTGSANGQQRTVTSPLNNAPAKLPPGHGRGPKNALPSLGAASLAPLSIPLTPTLLSSSATPSMAAAHTPLTWYTTKDGFLAIGLHGQSLYLPTETMTGDGRPAHNLGTPKGPFTLVFSQTQGGYQGASVQLAQFSLVVETASGTVFSGVTLTAPLTVRLQYGQHELDNLNASGLRLIWPATGNQAHHIASQSVPLVPDFAHHILTATITTLFAGPMDASGPAGDANQASSEHLTNDGNQGDVGFTVPLVVPPAAGGLAPALNLVYSSGFPNGRTERTAPAGWAGDGWNLTLGSISYDQTTKLYYLNGIDGVSEPLLCCMNEDGQNHQYFVPQHHPDIRVYTSNYSTNPSQEDSDSSCFNVRTPDGMEYGLGCTQDSRHETISSGSKIAIEWDTNVAYKVASTQSGWLQAYNVVYWQDFTTSGGIQYARDATIGEINYNTVNGKSLNRILFNIHWPGITQGLYSGPYQAQAVNYGTNYNCSSTPSPLSTPLRCDDPLTPSGWETAPLTMSTITLDSIDMLVSEDGGSTYHTVRQYQLSYQKDTPYSTCWDPSYTGQQLACAGEHLLSSVQEIPYQLVNTTDTAMPSLQPITFTYIGGLQNDFNDITDQVNCSVQCALLCPDPLELSGRGQRPAKWPR